MIWLIQQWHKGDWHNLRDIHGAPVWYFRKCDAQIWLRKLPQGRYRIVKIKD